MVSKLDKVLNHWVLLAFNIMLVIAIEATSVFFVSTGMIHLLAVFFIVLGVARMFIHYNVYDQYLKPLMYGGILTLVIFAASHILEYVSYTSINLSHDVIAANVVNIYLTGLLITTAGVEVFLKKVEKFSFIHMLVLCTVMGVCLALTALFILRSSVISLESEGWEMYAYGVAIVVVTIWGVLRLLKLKRHVSILVDFINYFMASFVLIAGSAMFYVTYEVLENIGVPYLQIVYVSHFLFYGALSLMFLAYVKLANLKGVYEEIKKS